MFCIALAVIGSAVQGSIGLGFGLLSAPILTMVDSDFVPGGVLVAVLPLSLWVAATSLGDVDRRGVGLALVGRIPGVIVGAAIVSAVSQRAVALGLSAAVLAAVGLSLWSAPVAVTPRATVGAGALSGFMGTATGVGGPPMALLYQRSDPKMVRATLAAFFAVGTLLSIVALIAAGDFTTRQLRLGLLLVPGVVAGLVASTHVQHWFHGPRFRPILLTACAGSAIVLAVKQLA